MGPDMLLILCGHMLVHYTLRLYYVLIAATNFSDLAHALLCLVGTNFSNLPLPTSNSFCLRILNLAILMLLTKIAIISCHN